MVILIQVFVKDMQNNTRTIHNVDTSITVLQFKQFVFDKTGVEVDKQRLIAGPKPLRDDVTLAEYNIHEEQVFTLVVRLLGGAEGAEGAEGAPPATETTIFDALELNQDVIFATTTKAVCVVYMDDDPETWRFALKGCGHALSSDALKGKIRETANAYQHVVFCPMTGCGTEIDYNAAAPYASMTEEEQKTFDEKLGVAVIRQDPNMTQCPHCELPLFRDHRENKSTCPGCRGVPFCWMCSQRWVAPGGSVCGNLDCGGPLAYKMNALENCATKKIGSQTGCYEIRICPQCERLIQHESGCKKMTCNGQGGCGHRFCFICLTEWDNGCGYSVATCPIAAVQTPTRNVA